jgi:hypothetical protein
LPNYDVYIEQGTFHLNPSCKYWFAGYGSSGGGWWVYDFFQGGIGYGQHRFQILRSAGAPPHWDFWIDVSLVARTADMNNVGGYAIEGLVSQWNDVTVTAHGYYSLQFNVGGTWYNWNAQLPNDFIGSTVTYASTPLCGDYPNFQQNDYTLWQAAENYPCS